MKKWFTSSVSLLLIAALLLTGCTAGTESGETVFYAVGLAHLLAEDGLINGLREAGYTVELVAYS